MGVKRFEDWPQRLDGAVELARSRAFEYGAFDCCLFAADVVLAITGADPAEDLRGRYDSAEGAATLLRAHGSIEALAAARFGQALHPAFAQRGDLAIATLECLEGPALDCAGICLGHRFAFPQALGLRFVPRSAVRVAFRVG